MNKALMAYLKEKSTYYPSIYIEKIKDSTYYSTLVRIKRENIWYIVHVIESFISLNNNETEKYLLYLINRIYKIQHIYKIGSGFEKIDNLQIDEEERISKEMMLYEKY